MSTKILPIQDLEGLTDRLSLQTAATEPTRPYSDFMAEMELRDSAPDDFVPE